MPNNNSKMKHYFKIADHNIIVRFVNLDIELTNLIPAFKPFVVDKFEGESLFELDIVDILKPDTNKEFIHDCPTGNGYTVVHKLNRGGYQFFIKDISKQECCLLETNADFTKCTCALSGDTAMRSFGLNNALMLIYAFSGSFKDTLLIHASCPLCNDYAYPFIAKSGTGKSTHSSLWIKNIPNTELLNDDNPVIRIINNIPYVYGSPWSGKTPCYRNISAPLGAIARISRADRNYVERLAAVQAFASFLPSCSTMKWDKEIYSNICDIVTKVIGAVPVYTMHCLPNDEAAIICHKEIAK